ncbi:MAG: hypothetical protein LC797_12405 [Chloroflexi bacterium]|nr:hypothetical protein [Chloroflexota bacterium]
MKRKNSPRPAGSALVLTIAVILGAVLVLPVTAFGQATPTDQGTPVSGATPQATTGATAAPAPALTLSAQSGLPGASITANGSGYKPGEVVDVSFNGTSVGSPTVNTGGTFSLSFTVPNVNPGQYGVLAKGQTSGTAVTTTFTVNQGSAALTFSAPQAAPGASLTVSGSGFQPGEAVQVSFNGAQVGPPPSADTKGAVSVTFVVPTLAPGQYGVDAKGQTSGTTASASYTVLAGGTPVPASAATATPAPAAPPVAAPNAPPIVHDDRYFSQTGYRIDNDQVWGFFNQYGGLSTFGYPVSRQFTFLGCPVQMFQRQIIQVCDGQGAALINMLDPDIFPYTQVNGSTFPAPDTTLKNNTPQVGSPTYSDDMNRFIQANVPDTALGQPVNFNQTFNSLGGLTIWGAPISSPQADPGNANFIYQRFQRGIMHYVVGQGTQSILLADYLKSILMNKDVPTDLMAQSRETRFFNQYAPGATLWLARPSELPGTDLTFAFVNG